jgi:TPR repeat protein
MNRCFPTVAAALMLGCVAAWGDSLEEGVAAHQRGEYATAIGSFKSLADDGNAAAQFNLGQMYRLGQGVPKNVVEAARLYHLAAAQGDAQSQYNLGVMYYNAEGVTRNFVFSHMWLTLSATSGAENAVRNRTMLAKQMTPEQITEALQLARACKQRDFKNCY